MNFYPAEVVTPPLALVALLGRPDLHPAAGEFLRSRHKPPINSIGVAEPASAARLFGEQKHSTEPAGPDTGIIKANWFAKHRQRRPAVAAVFLDRESATGDPSAWSRACASLEAVRAAAKPRGARIVVAIVQDIQAPLGSDLPDERVAMLARQAGVDRKFIVTVPLSEGAAAFSALGAALYEQAAAFYADDARRVLQAHAERKHTPHESNARTAFKASPVMPQAAALAEFRADWAAAARMYATAYSELLKCGVDGGAPLQRHFEIAACAELFHVKVVTLLLHQRRLAEALAQFRAHLARFRRPAVVQGGPPAAAAAHAGWLARQYAAMAELLAGRVDAAAVAAAGQRDSTPAALFLAAAEAAIERRHAAAAARLQRRSPPPAAQLGSVVPGRFVGTHAARGPPPGPLSDAEFAEFLQLQEDGVEHARAAISLLAAAHELYARGPARPGRLLYHVGGLMAREYLAAGDAADAAKLLASVTALYRQEGWTALLAASLLEGREAASRLGHTREHVALSLEVASLPRALDASQASAIAEAAVATLTAPQQQQPQPHSPTTAAPAPPSAGSSPTAAADADAAAAAHDGFHYTVSGADAAGLAACFALSVGFVPPAAMPESPGGIRLGVALRSNVPADLPVTSVTVELADADGSITLTAAEAPDLLSGGGRAAVKAAEAGGGAADAFADRMSSGMHITEIGSLTALEPRQWRAWAADIADRRPGRLALRSVTLHVAPAASFSWSLPELPQGAPVLGEAGDGFAAGRPPFSAGSGVAAGLWQVEGAGYAIVGERVPLTFVVVAGAALAGGSLAVSAGYREGLGGPKLFTAPPAGEAGQPAAELSGPARVPAIAAGGTARVRLLMSLPRHGQIRVSSTLTCQLAEAPSDALAAAAGIDVTVELPFSLHAQLSAPPRCAPLLLPAAGVSTEAALGGGSRVALPLRQNCVLLATLRVTAPCELVLEGCAVELPAPDPGEAAALQLPAGAGDAVLAGPAALRTGDIHCALFTVRGVAAVNGAALGSLVLRWRRARPAQLRTGSSVQSSQTSGAAAAAAAASDAAAPDPVAAGARPPAAAAPQAPVETVETRLPLPALDFAEPVLSVLAEYPPSVTAGEPFRYAVTLDSSGSALQQSLTASIIDGSGFVFAGPRQSAVEVLPRSRTTLAWRLVPTAAGCLPLPAVHIAAPGWDAALDASAGHRVFVSPAASAAA